MKNIPLTAIIVVHNINNAYDKISDIKVLKGTYNMNEIKAATAKIPLRLPRLNDITSSVLLILASRATALGMFPFGIAFFAAAYDKSIAYIGIAAVCAGIMSASGAAAVPKYVIALVILWLFSKLYRKKDELINAAAVAAALLCGGAVMLVSNYNGIYDIFLLITESIISALMYVVFTKSRMVSDDFTKRGRMSPEEYISAAVAAGVVISGLSGVMIGRCVSQIYFRFMSYC